MSLVSVLIQGNEEIGTGFNFYLSGITLDRDCSLKHLSQKLRFD